MLSVVTPAPTCDPHTFRGYDIVCLRIKRALNMNTMPTSNNKMLRVPIGNEQMNGIRDTPSYHQLLFMQIDCVRACTHADTVNR